MLNGKHFPGVFYKRRKNSATLHNKTIFGAMLHAKTSAFYLTWNKKNEATSAF